MTEKRVLNQDPWRELSARRGNRQVHLEEVVERLALEERAVQALKQELLARVDRLARKR